MLFAEVLAMNRTTLSLLIVVIAALGLNPASGQTHLEPYAIATVPTGDTSFDYLYGAAVDSTGNVYVADSTVTPLAKSQPRAVSAFSRV